MEFYAKELAALQRTGRLRERRIFSTELADLASNDYLGLAHNPLLAQRAFARLMRYGVHAPKASMLVNGYHPLHKMFEEALCEANGFEEGIILGSGFNANIAMIEALVRKGDILLMDSLYHASGQLAARLVEGEVHTFAHNDAHALEALLQKSEAKRTIIAVEGIYSMDGDLCNPQIIDLANRYNAILVMDEAHSSGVVGSELMGVFDHFQTPITPNLIKMGTLGKAYGSFGAYILASRHIIAYLLNRAKPVIYATAPSLFDTALGYEALRYIQEESKGLQKAIAQRQAIAADILGVKLPGLIVPVLFGDNKKVIEVQQRVLQEGIIVGAIRQPTVEKAIVRMIARVGENEQIIGKAAALIAGFR